MREQLLGTVFGMALTNMDTVIVRLYMSLASDLLAQTCKFLNSHMRA